MGKEACVLQRRDGCSERLQNSCLRVGNPGIMRTWGTFDLQLTARQYGEVVLPDDSTGQSSCTLAKKLSRCKEGMAHFLQSWYKFFCVLARSRYKFDRSREFIPGYKVSWEHLRSVAVQTSSKAVICQGAGF